MWSSRKALTVLTLMVGFALGASGAPADLLITEIVVTPAGGEFVEIYNPGGSPVDLTHYYLTDKIHYNSDGDYWDIKDGLSPVGSNDFVVRFPAGGTIDPGEYQTIAIDQADHFRDGLLAFPGYGVNPTYEIVADGNDDPTVPNMIETNVSVSSPPWLTNTGESVVVFYWDGISDLVTDIDYVTWGPSTESKVDKTGKTSGSSTYLPDTPVGSQLYCPAHSSGNSIQRRNPPTEGPQSSPGNGESNTDETSEDFSAYFIVTEPATPGASVPVELSVFRAY